MKEKSEDNRKFKNIIKRVLSIFGIGTMIALPTIATVTKDAKEEKPKPIDEGIAFRESLRADTPTVEGELNKLLNQNYEKTQYSNFSYDQLLNEFNNIMAKKGFDGISYELLKTYMDNVYMNYNGWKEVVPNMPDRETYIMEHIVNAINKVNSITVYSINSDEGQELLNEDRTRYAFTDSSRNITIIHDENEKNFGNEPERIGHELEHCYSDSLYKDEYYVMQNYLKPIISEGEATASMKFSKDRDSMKKSIDWIFKDGQYLKYNLDNEEGYAMYMNLYFNMTYLVGYKTMEDVSLGKIQVEDLMKIVEIKYGKESKDKIFENLQILEEAKEQENSEREFESAIALQKEFLNCIEKDIGNIKTKEQLDKYLIRFNYYKENNIVNMKMEEENITNKYFNINQLESMLIEKTNMIENQNVR